MEPSALPILEFQPRPGVIDLGWGHPDPSLLPVAKFQTAAEDALRRYGPDALQYGHPAGPGPFREWMAARLGQVDARQPHPSSLVASAGTSQALDLLLTLLAKPGDTIFTEDPTYHLALKIMRDHGLRIVAVPTDDEGIRLDALNDAIASLGQRPERPSLIYSIPTFNNPTGRSLSADRRQALADTAAANGIRIIEDDAYRELAYDGTAPPSLWSLAPEGVVVRLVSLSKSLAPGLRVGCIVSHPAFSDRLARSGLLDSGGGISHFASLAVAEFARNGHYSDHVTRLVDEYRHRRDVLLDALSSNVGHRASWSVPHGGYFAWLNLTGAVTADDLLKSAEGAGVSFMRGSMFYADPIRGAQFMRLGFTLYPAEQLAEAAGRLGRALDRLAR